VTSKRVKHLAELGLRATNLPPMVAFYRDVVGLEIVREFPGYVFMKTGQLDSPLGRGGHPQMLVLFDRQVPLSSSLTTLDHFAFEVALEDFEAEKARIEDLGLTVRTREFGWMHGRSFFFNDPDGNTIEFIAHDPTINE
jgi:catechol 2,3-dioxygenase-like lactoylglutathione lyase family enzyme